MLGGSNVSEPGPNPPPPYPAPDWLIICHGDRTSVLIGRERGRHGVVAEMSSETSPGEKDVHKIQVSEWVFWIPPLPN